MQRNQIATNEELIVSIVQIKYALKTRTKDD